MSHKLIYVIGPSGAGKDTILSAARQHLSPLAHIHWARRTITRPPDELSESHESVTTAEFTELSRAGLFALEWQANGLHYAIRREELSSLDLNQWVILNGSRQYLKQIAERFPGLTIVHITADPDIIGQRLLTRGRESGQMIAERLARRIDPAIPAGSVLIEIKNNSTIQHAVDALLSEFNKLGLSLAQTTSRA